MVNEFPTLLADSATTSPTELAMWTLAGTETVHGVRKHALLIANPNDLPRDFAFEVDGKSLDTYRTVKVFTVDDTHDGQTPVTYPLWSAPAQLTIGEQTVLLVIASET